MTFLLRRSLAAIVLIASLGIACRSRPEAIDAAKSPEQVVFARSQDDVVSGGMMFSPPRDSAKPLAIIWIHGWGVNFYEPSYVAIGRALAQQGYTVIDGNTRMHDLGNVMARRGGKRIRGGGYWGVAGEEPRDIAAWIDLAEAPAGSSASSSRVTAPVGERCEPTSLRCRIRGSSASCSPPALSSRT